MNARVQSINGYFTSLQETIAQLPIEKINEIVTILLACAERGNKVFIFGNGGSASTASHFACDLAKNTIVDGAPPFRVIALTDNVELLTAWANDTAYDNVFAAQLKPLIEPDDVVIGISCSGNSGNVLRGLEVARENGAKTIGFTGDKGGTLLEAVDLYIKVNSSLIEQQEDIHLALEHCICSTVRDSLREKYAQKN